jgi:hypothetical protein
MLVFSTFLNDADAESKGGIVDPTGIAKGPFVRPIKFPARPD